MRKRKITLSILMVVFITAVLLSIWVFFGTMKRVKELTINSIELSTVKDGVYEGEAEVDPVKVKLEVTVKDHKISGIKMIEHRNGLGGKAEDPVIKSIIEKQSAMVDTVSGATVSSKTIMKAVENALMQR